MKITMEPTTKLVELAAGAGAGVPARVWEGVTEHGARVHVFVTRIAIHKDESPEAIAALERELKEQRTPSADVRAYPARLII